jgi:hypothetical protein
MPTRDLDETIGRFRRRHKGEAGRPPGALADSNCSFTLEQSKRSRHLGTVEAAAALHRCVVVPEMGLEFLDCATEARKIALGHGRQGLHEDQPAQVSRGRFVERWKPRERCALGRAVHPPTMMIKNNQHTPAVRERHAADDRRDGGRGPASAIDHETSAIEQADAYAGAGTAAETDRIAANVERQAMQAPQSNRHRQGDMGARAEARMRRYDLLDGDGVDVAKAEKALHGNKMASRSVALGTADLRASRRADRDPGPRAADREPDAAE